METETNPTRSEQASAMLAAINPTGLKRGDKFEAHGSQWVFLGYIKSGCSMPEHDRHYVLAAETCQAPSPASMVVYNKPKEAAKPEEQA